MKLNIGSSISLKSSIDLDIRTITGIKTFHLGKKASFVINQREGLNGFCLKCGEILLNVSENLSMAFFWPKDPTDLERVEDRDLSNGTQVLVSYPEDSMSLDLGTADIKENVLPIYHDTGTDERAAIVKQIESLYNDKFAITSLYDTEEKAQASCAFKFDHWRQFRHTSRIQYEFCFKPVFKLDRIHKQVETNFGDDVDDIFDGYSEDPDKGTHDNYPGGIGSWVTSIPGCPQVHYYGGTRTDRIQLQDIIKNEKLDPQTLTKGVIPTFTYTQIGYREQWRYEWHTSGVIHHCSHPIYYPQWTFGTDWHPDYGHGWYVYTGKSRGSSPVSSYVDPELEKLWQESHPSNTLFYIFDGMVYDHYRTQVPNSIKLETTNEGRGNDPRVYDVTADRFKNDLEASASQFEYHVWCNGKEIVFNKSQSYSPVLLDTKTQYNGAIGYVEDRKFTTYYKMASCRITTVYFKVLDNSIDAMNVSMATYQDYLSRGQIEIIKTQRLVEKALNPVFTGSSFIYDDEAGHHVELTAENDSTFDSYARAIRTCYADLASRFQQDYFQFDYSITEGTKVIIPEACLSILKAGGVVYKGYFTLDKLTFGGIDKNYRYSSNIENTGYAECQIESFELIGNGIGEGSEDYHIPLTVQIYAQDNTTKISEPFTVKNNSELANELSKRCGRYRYLCNWQSAKVSVYTYYNYWLVDYNTQVNRVTYEIIDPAITPEMVNLKNYDLLCAENRIRQIGQPQLLYDCNRLTPCDGYYQTYNYLTGSYGVRIPYDSEVGKELINWLYNENKVNVFVRGMSSAQISSAIVPIVDRNGDTNFDDTLKREVENAYLEKRPCRPYRNYNGDFIFKVYQF